MNQNNSEELRHHGVKGMKWGHRKAVKLESKIKRLDKERAELLKKYGATNRSFINRSKERYLAQKQLEYQQTKNNNDTYGQINKKHELKVAKAMNKPGGTGFSSKSTLQKIYGKKLSDNELSAISITEYNTSVGRERTKQVLAAVGPIVASTIIIGGTRVLRQ